MNNLARAIKTLPPNFLATVITLAWLASAQVTPAQAGGVSVSVVNGQASVVWNGKEVYSGPSKGRVRASSSNINGEELAAALDGDTVLWESAPGAAQKLKENAKNAPARSTHMFPQGFNFNGLMPGFQAQGGGFINTSSTSISTRTVNGQTTVTVGGQEVFSGRTAGAVFVRTELRDGVPRVVVLDGGKVIYDSVNPVDEFAPDKNSGPQLPAGLFNPDGTVNSGHVVSINGTNALFHHLGGLEETMPLAKVAAVLFRPFPESKRPSLLRDEPGLLLRTGDYVEGQVKNIQDGKVEISSVLFGLKSYDTEKEAVALVLRKIAPEILALRKDTPPPAPQAGR